MRFRCSTELSIMNYQLQIDDLKVWGKSNELSVINYQL
ncbi:hypothetical protein M595_4811 [Lyngbya aestuarii BL J]|uniref:Uncharacterized protein n=1 Tax=Lyngbya aestuarii BL J TaxID=1348334 RepID=U7QDX6_9CYAN|nr:hypothetical protein M595_4811 [Lyngbya aestuarii BL J]